MTNSHLPKFLQDWVDAGNGKVLQDGVVYRLESKTKEAAEAIKKKLNKMEDEGKIQIFYQARIYKDISGNYIFTVSFQ